MKPLDGSTSTLVDRLAAAYVTPPDSPDEVVEILQLVADHGNPQALSVVLAFVWGTVRPIPHRLGCGSNLRQLVQRAAANILGVVPGRETDWKSVEIQAAALNTAERLISGVSIHDLPELDRVFRFGNGSVGCFAVGPNKWLWVAAPVPRDVPPGPARIPLLGLLAANGSGRTREAAVEQLAGSSGGGEIPFLLWRLADWVEPVRRRAQEAIEDRLRPEFARRFASALPLLRRLQGIRRVELSEIIGKVHRLLLAEPGQQALLAALQSADRVVRREACRVFDFGEGAPPIEVIDIVARDKDSVVRSWLVSWEVRLRTDSSQAAAHLRGRLLGDPATGIRRQALFAVIGVDDPGTADALRRALFDPSAMIRHVGRYYLEKQGEVIDFAAMYLARLQARKRPLAPAILGFGETAKRDDWKRLLPFLDGPPREARAALQAMARLDPETAQTVFLGMLADPRDGVCRQAFRWLASRQPEANADRLRRLWQQAPTRASRRVIARTILRLPPWSALDVLLDAVASDPEGLDGAARLALASWRPEHRAFYPAEIPHEELAASLRKRLEEMEDELPLDVVETIERGLTGAWERKHAFR